MSRRIAYVMNAATSPKTGLLRYGSRDTEVIFRTLTDPRLGCCDVQRSRSVTNCTGFAKFHTAFVKGVLKNWSPADQLIFYYSGHGLLQNDLFSLQLGPESTEALPFDNLLNLLRQHSVHRSILILDACHSGAATVKDFDESLFNRQLQNTPPGSAIIASCEQWEFSKEYPPERLSLFTFLLNHAICAGLPEETEREWLSIEDVLQQVETNLKSPALAHSIQNPRRKITDAGASLPFVRNSRYTILQQAESVPPATQFMEVCWSLPIAKMPLDQRVISKLRTIIQDVRLTAWNQLKRLRPRHKPHLREVRSNLFMPQISHTTGAGVVLRLEPDLHCGMKTVPELDLSFAPGQGTVGTAFQIRQPVVSLRKSKRVEDRNQLQTLTGAQLRLLHPQLRWILSLPVLDPLSGSPLAVLNLDGLTHAFGEEELLKLFPLVRSHLADLSTSLAALPRIHLHLGWSD